MTTVAATTLLEREAPLAILRQALETLFGRDFNLTDASAFFREPTCLWTLRVWVWKPNPAGVFETWNPRVTCEYGDFARRT